MPPLGFSTLFSLWEPWQRQKLSAWCSCSLCCSVPGSSGISLQGNTKVQLILKFSTPSCWIWGFFSVMMLGLVLGQTGCHSADKIYHNGLHGQTLSSYSWIIGSDLLQTSPILHVSEPSKHNIKMTLSFVMPLKLSLDVVAMILTWVLYVKEQEACSRQPFPPAPALWAGLAPALAGCSVAWRGVQCLPLML